MAIVGQVLLTPESGWKRIEEASLTLVGTWTSSSTTAASSGVMEYSTGSPVQILFNFIGTKFRVISVSDSRYSTDMRIKVDGVEVGSYSYAIMPDSTYKILLYELTGLENKEHSVSITNMTTKNAYMDAIDIDSTGTILPYNVLVGRCKTNLSAATLPGDYIWCKYTATSGAFGTFSDLATKADIDVASSLIPVASTATPNGYFKFILVGYDRKGRKKFIADRNIQHSISWDTLNAAGIASGSGVSVKIDNKDFYSVRLLTGGVLDTDKDNEWDRIIAESTLEGVIVAGDNYVWNWANVFTSTSTTIGGGTGRVQRGAVGSTSTYYAPNASSYTATNVGFRPVLLVASTPIGVTFNEIDPTHVYTNNNAANVKADIEYASGDVSWRLLVNGVEKIPFGDAQNIRNITAEANNSDLTNGNNAIKIEVKSPGGDTGEATVNIVKEVPYRTSAARTMLALDGGFSKGNISFNGQAKADGRVVINPIKTNGVFTVSLNKFTNTVKIN